MYGFVFVSLAIAVVSASLANEPCKPGDRKMDDCNSCICISDGSGYACTRKSCLPIKLTCEPGESFKEYCNGCRCGTDGLRKNAICTRASCPPGVWNQDGSMINPERQTDDLSLRNKRRANEDESCVPGTMKKMDCNTCRCVGNSPGRWACTLMACL